MPLECGTLNLKPLAKRMASKPEHNDQVEARERIKRQTHAAAPLTRFRTVVLCGYYPGQDFWNTVLPPQDRADFSAFGWENGYAGTIPNAIGKQVDGILTGWLGQQVSTADARHQLETVLQEVEQFKQQQQGDSEPAMFAGFLSESLRDLRDKVLNHDKNRDSANEQIEKIRTILAPASEPSLSR